MKQPLGLDIGGANLKAAMADGDAISIPFAIWKSPLQLSGELVKLREHFPSADGVALTMTAELADCFETKADGIRHIVASTVEAFDPLPIAVWQTSGEFVDPGTATEFPVLTAAANWHALATWAARAIVESSGLLIDIGSTTTDIIPIVDGMPMPSGRTDIERLKARELVYTGIRRTPVCAVTDRVPLQGRWCQLAGELFATTTDVFLLLDLIAEDTTDRETADGRPATKACAHRRLAHMLCADDTEISMAEITVIAGEILKAQRESIVDSLEYVLENSGSSATDPLDVSTLIVSGSGDFLAEQCAALTPMLASAAVIRLADGLNAATSSAAAAYALAVLAGERL